MIVPLNPSFEGIAAERFIALAKELKRQQRNRNAADFDRICAAEIQWCQTHPHLDESREEYEAAARILIDLARLSWEIHENGLGIELHSPTPPHRKRLTVKDIQDDKQRVQRELESLRNAQFQNESVREFIRKLEDPHPSTNRKSIICLIADGRELHARLQPALYVTGEERGKKLTQAIQPYLQLVESGEKDEFTGMYLGDIWRYFRYSWRIPQTPIPGRQMLYLVRDAAHPYHAVMGIASLNNAALQMPDRDDLIGWTVDAFEERIQTILQEDEPEKKLAHEYQWLMQNVESALDGIDPTDLIVAEERQNPTEEVVTRLRRRSEDFAQLRAEVLTEWAHAENEQPGLIQEAEASYLDSPNNPLPVSDEVLKLEGKKFSPQQVNGHSMTISKKRAFEFARLLHAKRMLLKYHEEFQKPFQIAQLFYGSTCLLAA